MTTVTMKYVSAPATPPDYSRYHGRKFDGTLPPDFWISEPTDEIPLSQYGPYTEQVDLATGKHTVEFGNSAESSNPWATQIYANDVLVVEGDVYRYHKLSGSFNVGEQPGTYQVNVGVLSNSSGKYVLGALVKIWNFAKNTLVTEGYTIHQPGDLPEDPPYVIFKLAAGSYWASASKDSETGLDTPMNVTGYIPWFEVDIGIPSSTQGTLSCKAYKNNVEVYAGVLVGSTQHYTPFTAQLDPGNYVLTATYEGDTLTKNVTITSGQTTNVRFDFGGGVPPVALPIAMIGLGAVLVAASKK